MTVRQLADAVAGWRPCVSGPADGSRVGAGPPSKGGGVMADYGRPVQFGVFPAPNAAEREEILALGDVADQRGLDLVGIQDHPYQRRYLDTWMLMPILLARTEQVRVFPDVTSLPLRPPAVLAKAAASLDLLSDGRFELGLGAGAFWDAIAAMGGQIGRAHV